MGFKIDTVYIITSTVGFDIRLIQKSGETSLVWNEDSNEWTESIFSVSEMEYYAKKGYIEILQEWN